MNITQRQYEVLTLIDASPPGFMTVGKIAYRFRQSNAKTARRWVNQLILLGIVVSINGNLFIVHKYKNLAGLVVNRLNGRYAYSDEHRDEIINAPGSNKEVAERFGISKHSVHSLRYRRRLNERIARLRKIEETLA